MRGLCSISASFVVLRPLERYSTLLTTVKEKILIQRNNNYVNALFSQGCVCDFNPSVCGADNISDQGIDPEGVFGWNKVSLHARCKLHFLKSILAITGLTTDSKMNALNTQLLKYVSILFGNYRDNILC